MRSWRDELRMRTAGPRWRAALVGLRSLGLLLQLVARDDGGLIGKEDVVVVAPHPDDEVLGCGAVIARARALGARVQVVVASDGGASPAAAGRSGLSTIRAEEVARSCERLGVPRRDLCLLGLPDGGLAGCEAELRARLAELVRSAWGEAPPVLFASSAFDPHPDHAATGRAARLVAAELGCRLYEYPIWQWNGLSEWLAWARASGFCGRPVKVSTRGFLAHKDGALAAHRSQLGASLGEVGPGVLGRNFVGAFFAANELFFAVATRRDELLGQPEPSAGGS